MRAPPDAREDIVRNRLACEPNTTYHIANTGLRCAYLVRVLRYRVTALPRYRSAKGARVTALRRYGSARTLALPRYELWPQVLVTPPPADSSGGGSEGRIGSWDV